MNQDTYIARTRFVSEVGLSLHACGATSQRIERHLKSLCALLEVHGTFLSTPTSFTFCYCLDDPTEQRVQIERIEPSDGDLGRLEIIDALVNRFESHELDFEEMCVAFRALDPQQSYYGKWMQAVAWGVLSVSFAGLFTVVLSDCIAAGGISLLVFLLAQIGGKSQRLEPVIEIIVSIVAGVCAAVLGWMGFVMNVPLVVLSSVIAFIPGLSLTVALSEIAERALVSGTSKLVHALMGLCKLYVGALLGVGVISIILPLSGAFETEGVMLLPEWKTMPLVVFLSLSLTLIFNIRPKLAAWCLAASLLGFSTAQWASGNLGVAAGMFLGAFVVGTFSNGFANRTNRPASIVLTQGLIVLVPGSASYMVLDSWITGQNMLGKVTSMHEAFLTFISLVIGLLLANAILPSRKAL
ncbi:threonine/serine exporter ThrE family protein [Rubritalea tangerina]|uniref:Threonine/serine exporter ThrE family protein n=2 Tax=Rubritalea tangerina TaxID=430798 RepID=A0ABW4ZCL3_9BACT